MVRVVPTARTVHAGTVTASDRIVDIPTSGTHTSVIHISDTRISGADLEVIGAPVQGELGTPMVHGLPSVAVAAASDYKECLRCPR